MSIDVFFMTLYGEVRVHNSIHSHPISSQQRFLLKIDSLDGFLPVSSSCRFHWVRDTVLGEDASQARTGSIPEVMAALRNTVLSVLRFNGHTKIAETLRFFAANPKLAVKLM